MNKLKKRRMKNKICDNKKKIIMIMIIVFLVFLSSGYALYNFTLNINGSTEIASNACEYNIATTFEITNSWKQADTSYYDVSISVTNNGESAIHDWVMNIVGPSDLGVGWMNGNYTVDGGDMEITPLSYNSTIEPGATLTFPFNLNTVEEELDLTTVTFNGCLVYGTNINPNTPLTSLEVHPQATSISVGQTTNLTISKTPSYKNITVTWTSSNTSIATVDQSGVVTGVAPGTATITASAEGLTSTSTITVTENIVVLESITVSPSTYRMAVGDVVPLQVTKNPQDANATITWTSSDTTIAVVDSQGEVTAISPGTATITASAGNITSTCVITVRDTFSSNDVRVTHQIISGGYYSGDSFQFTVTVENLTNEDISFFRIVFDEPDDLTWSNWQPHIMVFNGNTHEMIYDQSGNNVLRANGTYQYSGMVTFPEKYLESGVDQWGNDVRMIPEQYLEMNVLSIQVE